MANNGQHLPSAKCGVASPSSVDHEPPLHVNETGASAVMGTQSLLGLSLAPLTAIALSLLAVWISAMPRPLHAVSLDIHSHCPSGRTVPGPATVHWISVDADDKLAWDGQALASPSALAARLHSLAELQRLDGAELRIKPDPRARYGTLIAIVAAAQRAGVSRLTLIDQSSGLTTVSCPPAI